MRWVEPVLLAAGFLVGCAVGAVLATQLVEACR